MILMLLFIIAATIFLIKMNSRPGIKSESPELAGEFFTTEPTRKPTTNPSSTLRANDIIFKAEETKIQRGKETAQDHKPC